MDRISKQNTLMIAKVNHQWQIWITDLPNDSSAGGSTPMLYFSHVDKIAKTFDISTKGLFQYHMVYPIEIRFILRNMSLAVMFAQFNR